MQPLPQHLLEMDQRASLSHIAKIKMEKKSEGVFA